MEQKVTPQKEKYNKILTKEFLEKEYIGKDRIMAEIAKEVGCYPELIRYYLVKYDMPRRTKSECHKREKNGNFKGGRTLKKYYCKDCGKEINFNTALYNLGRCRSCAKKGVLSSRFGKPSPHGKRIKYKGICMRSSWEIAYAKYLDSRGIKWEYESKRFYFKDCSYCPDFYLPEQDKYIEIKGYWRDNTKKRYNLFKANNPKEKIEVLMKPDLKKLGIQL